MAKSKRGDDLATKLAGTQELSSRFAFDSNKPLEFDAAAALDADAITTNLERETDPPRV
jgi:hypothetical protein